MKKLAFAFLFCTTSLCALEYEVQLENEKVRVSHVKLLPHDIVGKHYDANPQVVIPLKGGTVTRLEPDGSKTEVHFPTGISVFRNAEPPENLHESTNATDEDIELIVIELK